MGLPKASSLDDLNTSNPIDEAVLGIIWPTVGRPPERLEPALKNAVLALSDTQIVTGLAILASGYSQIDCGLSIFHCHIVASLAWFSSATHLTSLTFLRRYIHDHRGIRTLRLGLMLLLVVILAVALVPTGGACGIQNAGQKNPTYISSKHSTVAVTNGTEKAYPGAPAKCCFELSYHHHFVNADLDYFLSMVASELVLISSTVTRVIMFFRGSSQFATEWFKERPARAGKSIIRKIEEHYTQSRSSPVRSMCFMLHSIGMVFWIYCQAIYDMGESIFWEISWLTFSLAWGTMRIFIIRNLANMDSAANVESRGQVVLQKNFWGFGQLTPTLLLILPVLSLAEVFLDRPEKSTDADSITSALPAPPDLANDPSTTEHETRVIASEVSTSTIEEPPHEASGTDLDRTEVTLTTRRTGTDLINMEHRLGTFVARQSDPDRSVDNSTSPETPWSNSGFGSSGTGRLWPSQTFYDHDFYTDTWYQEFLICLYLIAVELAIQFIIFTAGVGSKTITSFLAIYTSYSIYICFFFLFIFDNGKEWNSAAKG
ncbi:hypothetical protein BDZ45DRAFT_726201 [Acephala macrosclerotiorum]|nr:hypothetical protein BDZ45DRAFT_726201 [Acephala macrosclerotiorum]